MKYRVHHVRFYDYQPKAINAFACAEEARRLALSRSDGSIEIWSIEDDWYQEKIFSPSSGYSVEALLWNEGILYSAGLEGELVEYDMIQLKPKVQTPGHNGAIWCLSKSSSGRHIAAGTEEGCIVLYLFTSEGFVYERALDKQEGRILSLSWHPKGDVVVTGGIDNIRVWSVATGHATQRITLGRQQNSLETIVWSVVVLNDMTIVSGDSRGKTCFWNGQQGTLLKAFLCHKADVLCVCSNKAGDSVFSSGIDPAIVQFELAPVKEGSDWTLWVRSSVRVQHTHDIRALALCGRHLISGGIDTSLIFNDISVVDTEPRGPKMWRRIPPIPHHRLIHTAKKVGIVMFQYADYLEVFRLGSTNANSEQNGELLPISTGIVKLAQIRNKSEAHIVCSAISDDATWIACSDKDRLRVYRLHLANLDTSCPVVSLNRVKCLPKDVVGAAKCLAFVHDCQGQCSGRLVVASARGVLQVLDLNADTLEGTLVGDAMTSKGSDAVQLIRLMAVGCGGKYAAAVLCSGEVMVYSLHKNKQVLNFSRKGTQPTALAFSADESLLAVAYTDQRVIEYDVKARGYSRWCRENIDRFHPQWLRRHSKIASISYSLAAGGSSDKILVHDEQMVCVIDKTQRFPKAEDKIFGKQTWLTEKKAESEHAFHICSRYKFLLHFEELTADFAIAVECTPTALDSTLPAALRQKKFGT